MTETLHESEGQTIETALPVASDSTRGSAPELRLPTEQQLRAEIVGLRPREGAEKVCVATVCFAGTTRSARLKSKLDTLDYEAHNFGAAGAEPFTEDLMEDIAAGKYQAIVFTTPKVEELFRARWQRLNAEREARGVAHSTVSLNIPTRTMNLPESSGARLSRDSANPNYSQNKLAEFEAYIDSTFEKLGFIDRKSI